jgi:peptidoglycan/LPS O-acetylase OafA/YrhL
VIFIGFSTMEFLLASAKFNQPLWVLVHSPVRAIPTFTMGILISQTFNKFKIAHGLRIGFAVFCVSILSMFIHMPTALSLGLFSVSVFLTANGYLSTNKTLFDNRISLNLGNCSYSLYMLHAIFLSTFIDKVWWKLSLGPVPLSLGLLSWFVLIAVSILSYRYFESPMRKWMSPKIFFHLETVSDLGVR